MESQIKEALSRSVCEDGIGFLESILEQEGGRKLSAKQIETVNKGINDDSVRCA